MGRTKGDVWWKTWMKRGQAKFEMPIRQPYQDSWGHLACTSGWQGEVWTGEIGLGVVGREQVWKADESGSLCLQRLRKEQGF